MRSTTVDLPEDLDDWLQHEAARRGVTVAEVLYEAVREYRARRPPRTFRAAGAGSSGERDVSERIEEILLDEWSRK